MAILPGFPDGLPSAATFTGKFRLPFKVHHVAVYKTDSGRSFRSASTSGPSATDGRVEVRFDRDE